MKILHTWRQLKSEIGIGNAARALRLAPSTLWLWSRAYEKNGPAGLQPKFTNCGRHSVAEGVTLSSASIRELERLLATQGGDRAWQTFTQGSLCPAAVARCRNLPAPIARQVKLTPVQVSCSAYASADGRRLYIKVKFPKGAK